MRCRTGAWTTL